MSYLFSRRTCCSFIILMLFATLATTLIPTSIVRAEETPAAEPTEAEKEAAEKARLGGPATIGDVENLLHDVDTLWVCLAAFLVFFMQAGFALVEAGFTRAKNACNIIMKNLMDLSVGSLVFWMVGFGLMFGVNGAKNEGFWGTTNFFFDAGEDQFNWAFLIFQTVFCATAATIVSGAMAERTKFVAYLAYSFCICVFVYPIFGGWAWGGLLDGKGWLEKMGPGFYDFAGSTVVHSIGGWAALAGALVIGPRLGKYRKDGKSLPIPGHNIPIAALGVFILWMGWFGFNAGSTTAVGGGSFAYIAVTTNISAASGAVAAMFLSWILFKKPDTSFALNGALAGLVSITAGCPVLTIEGAIIAGVVGGVLCVFSVLFFDRVCKIDDPVGAISVHGVCGAWGTLAVGLLASPTAPGNGGADGTVGLFYGGGAAQLFSQAIGVGAGFLWAFPVSLVIFLVIKHTIGLRASEVDESEGLDISEHGMHAYPQSFVADTYSGSPMGVSSSPKS